MSLEPVSPALVARHCVFTAVLGACRRSWVVHYRGVAAKTYVRRRRGRWCQCCRSRWSLDTWRCPCHPAARRVRSVSSHQHAHGTDPSPNESCPRPCTTWPEPAGSRGQDTAVADGRPVRQDGDARSVTSPGAAVLRVTQYTWVFTAVNVRPSCRPQYRLPARLSVWLSAPYGQQVNKKPTTS